MARLFIIGEKVVLAAGGAGEIKLDAPAELPFKGRCIVTHSTGPFEITEISDASGTSYMRGTIQGRQLERVNDAGFLTDILDIAAKDYRLFRIRDTSGTSNTVYIGILGSVE